MTKNVIYNIFGHLLQSFWGCGHFSSFTVLFALLLRVRAVILSAFVFIFHLLLLFFLVPSRKHRLQRSDSISPAQCCEKIKFHVTSLSVLKVTPWVTPTHTKLDQRCCFLLNISPIRTCEIAILKCQVQPHHLKWTQNNQIPFISRLLWARSDIGSAFLHFAAFLHKCDVGYASEHSRGRKVCRSKEWKVSHNPPSCYSARDRKSI